MSEERFNKRAFVSSGLLVSALGLPFSGWMNHVYGFEALTMEKHLWMSVHNVLAIFFTFFLIWHLRLNWKAMIHSMKKISEPFIKKEAIYATSMVLLVLFLFVMHAIHLS